MPTIANREEQILTIRRERDLRTELAAASLRQLTPDDRRPSRLAVLFANRQLARASARPEVPCASARGGVGEVNVVVGRVLRRREHAEHAALS